MITNDEMKIIRECAEKYHVSKIILFGSALDEEEEANDIDLGVKGVAPELFFKFYGELFMRMPKPVDLVDLSFKSLFNDIVAETGVVIYG